MKNKPNYYRFYDLPGYGLYEEHSAHKPHKELTPTAKIARRAAQISTKPFFLIFGAIEKAIDASAKQVAKEVNGEITSITHQMRNWARRKFTP